MKFHPIFFLIFSLLNGCPWIEPYIQAELAMKNKELDKALELYKIAISKDSEMAYSYLGITEIYLQKGQLENAQDALEFAKKSKEGFDRENLQKYRALRMSLLARKGDMDAFVIVRDEFLANCYDIPRTYRTEDKIFLFNAPKNEVSRKMIESSLKVYNEIEEIEWHGDIAIFKLKK